MYIINLTFLTILAEFVIQIIFDQKYKRCTRYQAPMPAFQVLIPSVLPNYSFLAYL